MVNVSINVMVNLHLNLAGPPCPNKIHEEYERVSETEGEREILRNWFITGGLYMYLYIYKCTRFLRNLHAGQEAIVTTGHGTTDWFQIGKGVGEGTILSPCLFNLYTEYIMQILSWMKHKLESRLPGKISVTSDMQMKTPLRQKAKRN